MTMTPNRDLMPLAERVGSALPLLACLFCPVCMGAALGLFSAAGASFLLREETHSFMIGASLVVSMASIGWSAGRRRRLWPLLCSGVGALVLLAGHTIEAPVIELAGLALLMTGSIANVRRPRAPTR